MGIVVAIGVLVGLGLVLRAVIAHRRSVPTEVAAAKDARRAYRKQTKTRDRRISAATQQLTLAESHEGRRLEQAGGITLYERWIVTPQGSGSLLGVKATAADESSVRQRLTATRMVTLGVFALAAPKSKAVGNAYVVVEGPHVSGVAVIPANGNSNAGPKAFAFAAAINNAARAAEAAEASRPQAIEAARRKLAAANDRAELDAAAQAYTAAVSVVPDEYRKHFGDVPAPAAISVGH